MTLRIVGTDELRGFPSDQVHVTPLVDTDEVRALLLHLDAGQSVAPCQMACAVLYYVIEGQGQLQVGDELAGLCTGSLVVVPAGAVRVISAAKPMRVLAVQMQ
jgi:quercetin dioxygenase-like cupin family protein